MRYESLLNLILKNQNTSNELKKLIEIGEVDITQKILLSIFNGNTTDAGFADSALFGDYARDAISALYNCGAINGVGSNQFDPIGNATRAQAAKIVFGVLDYIR